MLWQAVKVRDLRDTIACNLSASARSVVKLAVIRVAKTNAAISSSDWEGV
jgi:hypothetical protein